MKAVAVIHRKDWLEPLVHEVFFPGAVQCSLPRRRGIPRRGLYVSADAPTMMMLVLDRRAGGCHTVVPALLIFSPFSLLLKKSGEKPHP